MTRASFEPYLALSEERLRVLRTDDTGLNLIRQGLYRLACDPRGLDEHDTWTAPREAEELLIELDKARGRGVERHGRDAITTRENIAMDRLAEKDQIAERIFLGLLWDKVQVANPDLCQEVEDAVMATYAGAPNDLPASRRLVPEDKADTEGAQA